MCQMKIACDKLQLFKKLQLSQIIQVKYFISLYYLLIQL